MAEKTQEKGAVDIRIELEPENFADQGGLFPDCYKGKFTSICHLFQQKRGMMSQADAMMMIGQRDKGGRTPIDIAW